MSEPSGAVFLSYTSLDAAAAGRICAALRAAGLEVWFDKSELRGGDAWDQKIRQQIRDCRLFVPIISANTQARLEGYFRREWKLACDRTDDMASEVTFLVPVVIDETPNASAHVPEAFRHVQWTRLAGGVPTAAFVGLIGQLLRPAGARGTPLPQSAPDAPMSAAPSPRQARRLPVSLLVAAGIVAVAAAAYLAHRSVEPPAGATASTAPLPGAAPSEKSLAVLPFVDLSERHDQEYFADGMAEEVIDLLAQVPDLKVIGRTSSFQFKGTNADLRTIARALGVNYVVEGSVRKSGDKLRVAAQLISAQDGSNLWSDTYDETVGNVLEVQDRIAASLVRALQLSVGGADYESRRSFRSAEAYDLYLRGLYAFNRYDKEGLESAAGYFEQLQELDPACAPATEWLALTQETIAAFGYTDPRQGFEQARRSALRALELNPNSSTAYLALATVHYVYDWDWAAAQHDLEQAQRVDPHDAGAYGNLANVYGILGRWDDATRLYQTAISLEPLDAIWHANLSEVRYATGRLDLAESEARKVLDISPTFDGGHSWLAYVLLARGSPEAALAQALQERGDTGRDSSLAAVYHAMGRDAESDSALARLVQNHARDAAYVIALVFANRQQLDQAFAWLERAYRQKDPSLCAVKSSQADPLLKRFARDPRFAAFLRKMNLPQ